LQEAPWKAQLLLYFYITVLSSCQLAA